MLPNSNPSRWENHLPKNNPSPPINRPSKRIRTSVDEFSADDHRVKRAAALLGLPVHELISKLRNRNENSASAGDTAAVSQKDPTPVPLASEEQSSVAPVRCSTQGNNSRNASFAAPKATSLLSQYYSSQFSREETYHNNQNGLNGVQSYGATNYIGGFDNSTNSALIPGINGFHSLFPEDHLISPGVSQPVGQQEIHGTSGWYPQHLSNIDTLERYISEPFLSDPFTPQFVQERLYANGYPQSMATELPSLSTFPDQGHSANFNQSLQDNLHPETDMPFNIDNATDNIAAILLDLEANSSMPDTSVTLGDGSISDRNSIPRDPSTPSKSSVLEYGSLPKPTPSPTGASSATRGSVSDDAEYPSNGKKGSRKGKRSTTLPGSSEEANNGSPGECGTANKRRKRGPFKNPQERIETSNTRKIGSCVRCHMQRVRCVGDPSNPGGTCLTCIYVSGETFSTVPCLRYKISDMRLYTKGNHPQHRWSQRWQTWKIIEIDTWASPELRTIELTQDVGSLSLKLQVRKFLPKEGDVLQRGWVTNGVQRWHPCATYAIADMEATGLTFMRYVDSNIEANINHYIGDADELLWKTYNMALRHSKVAQNDNEKLLIRRVLRLWVAIRYATRSDRICSKETLGTAPQDYDPDCTNYGHILVPPVISAQSELIMTVKVLLPMKEKILRELQDLIQKNKTKYWFTIYLATFILLHGCSMITNYEDRRAKKFGLSTRYHTIEFVRELHNGGNIVLAYFHYCCKGCHPFNLDWSSPNNIILADLNNEQVEFVKRSAVLIKEKKPIFDEVWQSGFVEHDFYFVSQLYDMDWKPFPII